MPQTNYQKGVDELMRRTFILWTAILGFTGVALGAFGAHGLSDILATNGHTDTFETANRYHLIHALALWGVAWLTDIYPNRLIIGVGYSFVAGTILFCGALYALAIFDISVMGAIAPLGGLCFLVGWGGVGWVAWRAKASPSRPL